MLDGRTSALTVPKARWGWHKSLTRFCISTNQPSLTSRHYCPTHISFDRAHRYMREACSPLSQTAHILHLDSSSVRQDRTSSGRTQYSLPMPKPSFSRTTQDAGPLLDAAWVICLSDHPSDRPDSPDRLSAGRVQIRPQTTLRLRGGRGAALPHQATWDPSCS